MVSKNLFSKAMVLSALLCLPVTNGSVGAQESENDLPFPEYFALKALYAEDVQNELELVDEQKAELRLQLKQLSNFKSELDSEMRKFAATATEEEIRVKRAELNARIHEFQSRTEESFSELLLPHQQNRLRQVAARVLLREAAKTNKAGVLAPQMAKWLEIDDEQAKRLKARAEEIRKRLAADIERLTREAQDELLQELTPEQRKKYENLIGAPMEKAPGQRSR